jgi:hypothetical protein
VLQSETWSLSGGVRHRLKGRSTREKKTCDDDDNKQTAPVWLDVTTNFTFYLFIYSYLFCCGGTWGPEIGCPYTWAYCA